MIDRHISINGHIFAWSKTWRRKKRHFDFLFYFKLLILTSRIVTNHWKHDYETQTQSVNITHVQANKILWKDIIQHNKKCRFRIQHSSNIGTCLFIFLFLPCFILKCNFTQFYTCDIVLICFYLRILSCILNLICLCVWVHRLVVQARIYY